MSKLIDLTNKDFGYWHVLERAKNNAYGAAYWKCECKACGTIKNVSSTNLRRGESTNCGCIRMKKMRQASIKHEEGKTYGFLFVNRMATEDEKPRKDAQSVYWNCSCLKCGKENVIVRGDYLRNGDTKSCGCLVSYHERHIQEMLNNLGITYTTQQKFEELTSTGRACDRLMFDIAVYDNNTLQYLIEYDGSQHFVYSGSGWHTKEYLERTHRNDLLKNKYCFEHHIPLIRIPYDVEYNLNDLKLETTRFLLIPENEEEYYQRYLKT